MSFGASFGAVVGARVRVALVRKACSKSRSERRLEPWLALVYLLHLCGRRAPNVVRSVVWSRGWSSCTCCIDLEGVLQMSFGASFGAVVGARVLLALVRKACSKRRSERRLEPWL